MSEFMDIGRAIARITNAVGSCGSAIGAEQLTFIYGDVAGRRHFLLEKLVTEKKISEEKSRRKSIWQ